MLCLPLVLFTVCAVIVPTISMPVGLDDIPAERVCQDTEYKHGVVNERNGLGPSTSKELIASAKPIEPVYNGDDLLATQGLIPAEKSIAAGQPATTEQSHVAKTPVESLDGLLKPQGPTGSSLYSTDELVEHGLAQVHPSNRHTEIANRNGLLAWQSDYLKEALSCLTVFGITHLVFWHGLPESREYFLDPSKKVFLNGSLKFWTCVLSGGLHVLLSILSKKIPE
ncbi:hypothetical protein PGT21_009652 [Puccinia graminis f. sp. tritici]|uniref:Uncharacterized protein n=1 Tax=Puccinia graminis f. sp. tritici TaxID=56615 RepID=A0A5B0R022_PUCGR|nr:hypothetical protein PGT21_009652 [Puccinia graminis f. sp. tritici]